MLMEIITTDWILGIAGTIIIGLFVAVMRLIAHIWKERKEMLIAEKTAREERDKQFAKELKEVREMHGAVTTQLAKVGENMNNLTGWIKQQQLDLKQTQEDVQEVEKEVAAFKGK